MGYVDELLERLGRRSERPMSYDELLIEPVVDGPAPLDDALMAGASEESYGGWEQDHAAHRRFYVAGIQWFKRISRYGLVEFQQFRRGVAKRVRSDTNWSTMYDPNGYWDDKLGKPPMTAAWKGRPVTFAKGAQILMACETALDAALENVEDEEAAKRLEKISSGLDVYRNMGLYPACCNIDNFGEHYLKAIRDSEDRNVEDTIADGAAVRDSRTIIALAEGKTVTRRTATRIQLFSQDKFNSKKLGNVRAKPGRHWGEDHAAETENWDE